MKVVIVGAGLGGLACAIACRRQGLEVDVLERTATISPVRAAVPFQHQDVGDAANYLTRQQIGAGIQIPPNAARVCLWLGILPQLASKSITLETITYRRYATGESIYEHQLGDLSLQHYGAPWMVIHRSDYQQILFDAAKAAGANIRLGATVTEVDFEKTQVLLSDQTVVRGDVIIGADGLWSLTRNKVLGYESAPTETGDLAYRGTFSKKQLLDLKDPAVEDLCSRKSVTVWMGPEKHAVFYPVRGGQQFNLVLLRPDNLPHDTRTESGSLDEMRDSFEGWDDILKKIISCIPSALKWKLCHHEELKSWTRGNVALLGDACHPTLPYQAQGAAMAVEDGAVLGKLLGLLNCASTSATTSLRPKTADVLKLYESLRKRRTTTNVQGAMRNRKMYHLPDGPEQERRDAVLQKPDLQKPGEWKRADRQYNMEILGFDAVQKSEEAFHAWLKTFSIEANRL